MVGLFLSSVTVVAAYTAGQPVERVALSLKREYGRALYRDCRLDVTIFEGQGRTSLHCNVNSQPPRVLREERALTSDEVKTYSELVPTADLCGGGHTGVDGRPVDAVLETLMTNCPDGRVAVLVTSGNPTFKANERRRQLLDRLHALEDGLRKSAPQPK